jgi:hypothetical protein
MFNDHPSDMPVQFFLVLFYDGRKRLFFRYWIAKLNEQFGISYGGQGHAIGLISLEYWLLNRLLLNS